MFLLLIWVIWVSEEIMCCSVNFLTMNESSMLCNLISLNLFCYDCFKVITELSSVQVRNSIIYFLTIWNTWVSYRNLTAEEYVSRCFCSILLLVSDVTVIANSNSDGANCSITDTEMSWNNDFHQTIVLVKTRELLTKKNRWCYSKGDLWSLKQ